MGSTASDFKQSIGEALANLHAKTPLVHNITNNVTINDCANALLAIGGSPIMGNEKRDVEEITQICDSLVINIGTLTASTVEAMFGAGAKATELGHPIVLDPVGVGASQMRDEIAARLLDELDICVVRGNISEVKALAGVSSSTRGVDAAAADAVTRDNLEQAAEFACSFAASAGVVAAITGPIDIIADATRAVAVFNGSYMQGRMTGAGCLLSSVTGAYVVSHEDPFIAALAAVCSTGVAGQVAEGRMGDMDGTGSFRTYLLDALFRLTPEQLSEMAQIEVIRG